MRYDDQVTGIPKVAAQDTTLTVSNVNGEKTTFPVPSGTQVELHVPGLHHNRTLVALCRGGQYLMKFDSTILEGAAQVHARAVPRRLAEGCIPSIQSRYILPIEELASWLMNTPHCPQVPAPVWGDGAKCCVYLRVVLTNFFQVFRN
jgi:hypothetical protein